MKIKKILVRGLIVLLLLIVVAALVASLFLGSIVKKGVETFGPQITKVNITLDSVSVGLLTASGSVKGLIVGNPDGYKTPQAISVGLASASISPFSLLSDKIVIRSVRVDAPEITFEGGLLHNNLTTIKDNVSGTSSSGSEATQTAAGPSKKLEVDDFVITGAKVHIAATGTTLPIPDIHLTNLGTGPDGITAGDLTKRVMDALVSGTLQAVTSSAANLGNGAGKAATDVIGKAGKSLSNLFKN
jgi:uncharacterized protein involved in outer membrane biogenesis